MELGRYEGLILHQHRPPDWTLAVIGTIGLLLPLGIPGRRPLLSQPPCPPFGGIEFTLLDVGQGFAAVVKTQQHILI